MHFSAESKRAPSYFPLKRGPLNPLKGRRKQVNENENEKNLRNQHPSAKSAVAQRLEKTVLSVKYV